MASWAEYHTGVLKTNYANFGVTEGELLIAGAVLIGGLEPYFFEITGFEILTKFGVSTTSNVLLNALIVKDLAPWLEYLLQVRLKNLILKFLYVTFSILIILFVGSTIISCQKKGVAISQFIPVFFNIATSNSENIVIII